MQEPSAPQTPNVAEVMRKAHNWRLGNGSAGLVRFIGLSAWTKIIDTYEDEIGAQNPFTDLDTIRGHAKAACENTTSDSNTAASHMEHTLFLLLAIVAVLQDPDISQLADSFTQESRDHATAKAQEEAVDEQTIQQLMLIVSRSRPVIIDNECFHLLIQANIHQ